MKTKDKIIWESLDLFAQRGYKAVSVRDIAAAVGIRESSLYNHFPSKQEIFNAIVDICWQKAEDYYHSHSLPFAPNEDMAVFHQKGSRLEDTLLEIFRYFFEDPWNTRFRRLLALSRYDDPHAGELYRRLYCQYPMQVQQAAFAGLIRAGEMRQADPQVLALEFYGGVYLLLELCGRWQEAEPRLREHIRLFTAQQARELEKENEKKQKPPQASGSIKETI